MVSKEDIVPLLLAWDFVEGELGPVGNKNVSYLVEYLHYISKNINLEVAMEMDKLDLDKHYNRALKVAKM